MGAGQSSSEMPIKKTLSSTINYISAHYILSSNFKNLKNQKKQKSIKMRFLLRKFSKCFHYTLKEKCPKCSNETISVHPAKFSPDDKYMRYRLAERYS